MSRVTVTRFRENHKDDYEAMKETLYLLGAKGMKERFEQALTAKPEDCVPLSEVWPDV
jgi:hypothetical protein